MNNTFCLTLRAHAREGYSTHFVSQSVSQSLANLEDGSPSTWIEVPLM